MRDSFVRVYAADLDDIGADASLIAVWLKMSSWAAWKAHRREFGGQTFHLASGQLVTAENALARALGLGRAVVRRCLTALAKMGKIVVAPSKAGTLITIKRLANVAEPEGLGPEDVPDEPEAIQPGDQPGENTGDKIDSYNPRSCALATVSNDPLERVEKNAFLPDESEAIQYAQRRMGRIVGGKEGLNFLQLWREVRGVSLAEVKRRVEWLVEHPLARRDTTSISRVFHIAAARNVYAAFDREIERALADSSRRGLDLKTTTDEITERMPTCDPGAVKSWLAKQWCKAGYPESANKEAV